MAWIVTLTGKAEKQAAKLPRPVMAALYTWGLAELWQADRQSAPLPPEKRETREGLTQRQLSEMTGIPQRHLSEMENGKRIIGKETAKKLGTALNADYRAFL